MEEEILQLGASTQKQTLTISSSFVQRARPSNVVNLSTSSSTPYVVHVLNTPSSSLLSYTDDGLFRFHDKASLNAISQFQWQQGGKCSSIKSFDEQKGDFITCGSSGKIGYWDVRQQTPTIFFESPSNSSYLSIACSKKDHLLASGTELQGAEAKIDLWDIRKASIPLFSYIETHSDDITSLNFHPTASSILLSAASDALIAVSDTRQSNEDDSVIGVINAGASVARAGWGGSSKQYTKLAQDEDTGLTDIPSLGAFYGVTDMQTIAIWEADGFTELLPTRDVRQTQMEIGIPSHRQWETEYVIDAGYTSSLLENPESVGLFCGTQDGGMALVEVPHNSQSGSLPSWSLHCLTSGGHSDIVRSIAWDSSSFTLFSGGEDGKLCAWSLSGDQSFTQEHSLNALNTTLTGNSTADQDQFESTPGLGPNRNPLKGSSYGSIGRTAHGKDTQRTNYRPY